VDTFATIPSFIVVALILLDAEIGGNKGHAGRQNLEKERSAS